MFLYLLFYVYLMFLLYKCENRTIDIYCSDNRTIGVKMNLYECENDNRCEKCLLFRC